MKAYLAILLVFFLAVNCKKKDFEEEECTTTEKSYEPTIVQPNIPQGFPQMAIPQDNPLTIEGIELGRHLFYEKKLSGNNTMSCGSCHAPSLGFSDSARFSVGIDNIAGTRQAMPIMNLGWKLNFFWDGRSATLEDQAFLPVVDEIEMHENWPNAVSKLQSDPIYPDMFRKAFGTDVIDSVLVVKAIAQFERTLISGNSKYDRVLRREEGFTPQEANGFSLFSSLTGGDCFHCHGGILTTDHSIQNNGLDATLTDLGLGAVTGLSSDNGKFKVPSLRNLVFTAPYMHDGRFNTLDEVIDFYSTGVHGSSPNISPNMEFASQGGVNLTPGEKADLKAFLLTLTDSSFITNPDFQDPN